MVGYGQFFTVAINFIIVAWVLFLFIRAMNRPKRQEDAKLDMPRAPEIPTEVNLLSKIRIFLHRISNEEHQHDSRIHR